MSEINTVEVSTPAVAGQKNLPMEDKPSPSAVKEQPLQIPAVKEKNTVLNFFGGLFGKKKAG